LSQRVKFALICPFRYQRGRFAAIGQLSREAKVVREPKSSKKIW